MSLSAYVPERPSNPASSRRTPAGCGTLSSAVDDSASRSRSSPNPTLGADCAAQGGSAQTPHDETTRRKAGRITCRDQVRTRLRFLGFGFDGGERACFEAWQQLHHPADNFLPAQRDDVIAL